MVEILKPETQETDALLAQFNEIEEWSDYVALTLETAKRWPNNLTLRDQIAEDAEEGFIDGRKLVLKIYRDEAERKAGDEEEAECRGQAIALGLDPDSPPWYVKLKAREAAEKSTTAARPEVTKVAALVAAAAKANPQPEPEPEPTAAGAAQAATAKALTVIEQPKPEATLIPVNETPEETAVREMNDKHAVISNLGG
jgi:hypothetical protein